MRVNIFINAQVVEKCYLLKRAIAACFARMLTPSVRPNKQKLVLPKISKELKKQPKSQKQKEQV